LWGHPPIVGKKKKSVVLSKERPQKKGFGKGKSTFPEKNWPVHFWGGKRKEYDPTKRSRGGDRNTRKEKEGELKKGSTPHSVPSKKRGGVSAP